MCHLCELVQRFHSKHLQIVLISSCSRVPPVQVVPLPHIYQSSSFANRVAKLSVHPVHLHHLEERSNLLLMRLLIDVDDVVEGQNASPNSLHLVKQL